MYLRTNCFGAGIRRATIAMCAVLCCHAPVRAEKKGDKPKAADKAKSSSRKKHAEHRERPKPVPLRSLNFLQLPVWRYGPYSYGYKPYAYPYRDFDSVYPGYSPYRYEPYRGAVGFYASPPIRRYLRPPSVGIAPPVPASSPSLHLQVPTPVDSPGAGSGPPSSSAVLDGPGWRLLASGRTSAALESFGKQMKAERDNVASRVGYAIAAGSIGNLASSVRAMREACSLDAHALHYAQLDAQFLPAVQAIASRCASPTRAELRPRDAMFLQAAFSFLTGEPARAKVAIDRVAQTGDRHSSTLALRAAVYEHLGKALPADD
ncbi:MAG: hypothetical protein KDA42_19680 [Planctomycetales bacterium]|nr:hypothetical protein [Planctomycetales bacterium]